MLDLLAKERVKILEVFAYIYCLTLLSGNAPYFIILLCLTPDPFTLSNARRFYLSGGECCHSVG